MDTFLSLCSQKTVPLKLEMMNRRDLNYNFTNELYIIYTLFTTFYMITNNLNFSLQWHFSNLNLLR